MFSLTEAHRYYLYLPPTDMRKSFDALCGLIQAKMNGNPRSGEVFIFINRRRDQVKLLHWEQAGFVLYYKRLEQGTFELPQLDNSTGVQHIAWSQLVMIVQGIVLKSIQMRKRYI